MSPSRSLLAFAILLFVIGCTDKGSPTVSYPCIPPRTVLAAADTGSFALTRDGIVELSVTNSYNRIGLAWIGFQSCGKAVVEFKGVGRLFLYAHEVHGVGTYPIGDPGALGFASIDHDSSVYHSFTQSPGYLKFTKFDLDQMLVSGSFMFRARKMRPTADWDDVQRVEGEFTNLRLVPQN